MSDNCTLNDVNEVLMEIFRSEQAARSACAEHWATGRRARVLRTSDATALVIRDDGTPDPGQKVEVITPCFVVYSEG
jgi:hypothetical protein